MEIENRIQSDLKEAIKSGDSFTRDVLRLLSSDIKNKAINDRKELTDEDVLAIVKKNIKSRKDSIEQFTKGGREDLAAQERSEVELLEKYMPEQMGQQQIEEIVKKVLSEMDASESLNFGIVMKKVMVEIQGKADGSVVSEIVKKALIV
jgi:uncharacterized protein YqeY